VIAQQQLIIYTHLLNTEVDPLQHGNSFEEHFMDHPALKKPFSRDELKLLKKYKNGKKYFKTLFVVVF
jgi:hypothetical protein